MIWFSWEVPRVLAKLANPRQVVSGEPEDVEKTWAAVRQLTAALNRNTGFCLHRSDKHEHLKKYVELSRSSPADVPQTFFELDHMEMPPKQVYRRAVEEAGHLAGAQGSRSFRAAGQRRGERSETERLDGAKARGTRDSSGRRDDHAFASPRMSVFGSVTARTPSMTTLTILFLLLTAKVVAAVTVTAAK